MRTKITLYALAGGISFVAGIGIFNMLTPEAEIPLESDPIYIVEKSTNLETENLPPIYIEERFKLKKRETLTELMHRGGLSTAMAAKAMHKLQRLYNVKQLRPGQTVNIRYTESPNKGELNFHEVEFFGPDDKHVYIKRGNADKNNFTIEVNDRTLQTVQIAVYGEINDSLYASAQTASLPTALVPAFANLFSWEIDFTRDIRPGDTFSVVYERILDEEGKFLKSGKVIAAQLNTKKKSYNAFRWESEQGWTEYYSADGYNKKRTLLRTPLEFTRISSHFNLKRRHPILGYTRAHKGTDFAAPTGTPIKAAGDGVIEMAKWNGGYGRFIRIRHDKKFKTAYAHMHRFAKGMRSGKKVRQGQIIGYVGTTGRSTGPHLHYEVYRYGKQVNPMTVKLPTSQKVVKKDKAEFDAFVAKLSSEMLQAEEQYKTRSQLLAQK